MKKRHLWTRVFGMCLLLAMSIGLTACGTKVAPVRGNLEERFGNIQRLKQDEQTFYKRGRLSTVLLTGVMPDTTDGRPRTDFVAVIAINDDEKRITPIYIDGQTMVEVEGESMPLREVFSQGDDSKENCERLQKAVDGLLGEELIENYMAVDLEGIKGIAEFSMLEGDTRERLHLLRMALQSIPSKQLNQMYGAISAYLITDMKSGAVMRVLDKTDRYEIVDTLDLPVLPAEAEGAPIQPDSEKTRELVIDVFYRTDLF